MTRKQQKITIAKHCGWKWHSRLKGSIKVWDNGLDYVFYDSDLPDYLNDLNAMHEAEKTLNPIQAAEYARMLTSTAWQSEQPVFAPMTAKADQRAEAFLRTIGKWTTNQNEL